MKNIIFNQIILINFTFIHFIKNRFRLFLFWDYYSLFFLKGKNKLVHNTFDLLQTDSVSFFCEGFHEFHVVMKLFFFILLVWRLLFFYFVFFLRPRRHFYHQLWSNFERSNSVQTFRAFKFRILLIFGSDNITKLRILKNFQIFWEKPRIKH